MEEAFNTPKWITNLRVSNANLWYGLGFSVAYKHQSSFLWQSSLATGMVPAIHTVDAQTSYRIQSLKLDLKLGATNLTNRSYSTFVAGPSVGGFYYVTLTWQ
ncbi:TonB-dependent receptor [Larkinella arboricola]|uniref:TonB-dependent receptor n=1 Tax=Larkinella arboricola TaxID=643671 RepID=UPI000DB90128|nr:TonB-dependent receptor [Larkinella arboricola]